MSEFPSSFRVKGQEAEMGWKGLGLLVAVLWIVPAASPAQTVTIRTYNHYGVGPADMTAARPHVESIFAAADIEVKWLDCWYRTTELAESSERCRQPLEADELMLRLQAANAMSGKQHVSMGFALVNVAEGTPFLATVFADLVRSVASGAHLEFSVLLGRAIAHEIGHLLLDNNRHPGRGLMRAGWSHAELRTNDARDWTFDAGEIAAIRTATLLRNSTAAREGN